MGFGRIFRGKRRFAPSPKDLTMTLLYVRQDLSQDLRQYQKSGFGRDHGASIPRFVRRISIAFRLLHRAIVRAKLRRLSSEFLFRRDYSEMLPLEEDATKFRNGRWFSATSGISRLGGDVRAEDFRSFGVRSRARARQWFPDDARSRRVRISSPGRD
jgi:hypothetical protein